jgi:hypothetical protein
LAQCLAHASVGGEDSLSGLKAGVRPGNGEPKSLLAMAEGNSAVQEALRRHGAA